MALLDLYEASKSEGDFWKKVAGACLVAARDIDNEDPGTTNHANRVTWAAEVREVLESKAKELLPDVLTNPTIQANVAGATDNDIQFVVNSLIDTYATG
jgi:hypothetical protein